MDETFYFWNCEDIWHSLINSVTNTSWKTLTPIVDNAVINHMSSVSLTRIFYNNRQVILVQITSLFNVGGTQHISSWVVQFYWVFMGYGSRRNTRVLLLPYLIFHIPTLSISQHQMHWFNWVCDIVNWTLVTHGMVQFECSTDLMSMNP